jgi:hypothetical protein
MPPREPCRWHTGQAAASAPPPPGQAPDSNDLHSLTPRFRLITDRTLSPCDPTTKKGIVEDLDYYYAQTATACAQVRDPVPLIMCMLAHDLTSSSNDSPLALQRHQRQGVRGGPRAPKWCARCAHPQPAACKQLSELLSAVDAALCRA